jgi:hypothetical protein
MAKKPGDIFEMNGKKFEFVRMAQDAEGKFVEAWELGKNGQRRFIVTIRPEKTENK